MDDIVANVVSHILIAASSAIGASLVWIGKTVMRAKKDLDAAHEKIRNIEDKLHQWRS